MLKNTTKADSTLRTFSMDFFHTTLNDLFIDSIIKSIYLQSDNCTFRHSVLLQLL